jgi:selenocysteine lyase/cysteine desulfurase
MLMDWHTLRARFPVVSRVTYLNTASAPPISTDVAAAGTRYYDEMLAEGDLPWDRWLAEVEDVRAALARFINASPEDVAFIGNASQGLALLARMVKPNGPIVTMADEFPSSTLSWLQQGRDVRFVASGANGTIDPAAVDRAITADTAAVVTSHVQFKTGFRCDLARLATACRARGVPLLVDAAQSLGAMPVDVTATGVDALVFSGYKWPMAGYGNGGLFVRRALREAGGVPVVGWMSARDPDAHVNDRLDLKATAAVVEVGCPNFAGIFALGAAIRLLDDIGIERITDRIHELTDRLHAGLIGRGHTIASPLDRDHRAGITIVVVDDAPAVVAELARRHIIVSARGQGIRISLHVFNLPEDVDTFLAALDEIVAAR